MINNNLSEIMVDRAGLPLLCDSNGLGLANRPNMPTRLSCVPDILANHNGPRGAANTDTALTNAKDDFAMAEKHISPESTLRHIREWDVKRPSPVGPDVPDVTNPLGAVCYFIAACDGDGRIEIIKIGFTTQITGRMNSLRSNSGPYKLVLVAATLGGRDQERSYHRRFAEHHLGSEWFSPHPDILAEIERLKSETAA